MRKVPPFLLLDVWRGLAAFWVVMVHASYRFTGTVGNERFLQDPFYWFSSYGQLGVVIFFVISGYCIMGAAYSCLASGKSAARYGRDRVFRIYPPYVIAFILAIAVGLLINFAQSHHILPPSNHSSGMHLAPQSPKYWLTNLFLVQQEAGEDSFLLVAWSLCYEAAYYIVIGLLLFSGRAVLNRFGAATALACIGYAVSVLTLTSVAWLAISPETCPVLVNRWYQFGLGALLFLSVAANSGFAKWSARLQVLLPLIVAFVLALGSRAGDRPFLPGYALQAGTAVSFVILLCLLLPLDSRLAHRPVLRPLMWLGTFSYSVYLVHTIFIDFVEAGGRRLGFDMEWYRVTYVLQIVVSIFLGWLFYLVVERHFISSRQKKRVSEELSSASTEPRVAVPSES